MNIYTHTQIKEAAAALVPMIEKYRRDYANVSNDLKPEVAAQKKKELHDKFNAEAAPRVVTLQGGIEQLKKERDEMGSPERHLVLNGIKAAKDMKPGEVWLAQAFEKMPEGQLLAAIEKIDNDAVRLAAYMATDETTLGKKAAAALLEQVTVDTPAVRSLVLLEQEAVKALYEYEDLPGARKSPANRMALGRQISNLDKTSIPAT